MDKFNIEEKRDYLLKKHIKENLSQYIIDMIVTILFSTVLLYWCKAESFVLGIVLSVVYSLGKSVASIRAYKKTLK